MNRRGFLKSILAAGVAPYVVTTAGVLMPVRAIAAPELVIFPHGPMTATEVLARQKEWLRDCERIISDSLGVPRWAFNLELTSSAAENLARVNAAIEWEHRRQFVLGAK